MSEVEKEFSAKELSQYDGTEGRPVYIAHKGRVIDVTNSKLWKTGKHMNRHSAGRNLTEEFKNAPHGLDVLDRYPQVGVLKGEQKTAGRRLPGFLARLFKRFPLLRRHPHPMLVHFPIVFMTAAPVFTLLYVITGHIQFDDAALDCLGGGVIFTPLAMLTGFFSWWLNYMARFIRPVKVKIILSPIMLAIAVAVFIWRLENPSVLSRFTAESVIYLALVISLIPLVVIIGWFGAQITFPIHEE